MNLQDEVKALQDESEPSKQQYFTFPLLFFDSSQLKHFSFFYFMTVDGMGGAEAREKFQVANSNMRQNQAKVERYNGRMQGLNEQKRNLKKKLNEP